MMESGSKDTIEAIFERAIQIEDKAANVYREFSRLFSHIPEISALWSAFIQKKI